MSNMSGIVSTTNSLRDGPFQADVLVPKVTTRLHVLHDLTYQCAADMNQSPIVAYPQSTDNELTYSYFTAKDLHEMINRKTPDLIRSGITPCRLRRERIALLALSDLTMVLTLFSLSRLGYSVLMLSPRLAPAACIALLDETSCNKVLYGQNPAIRTTIGEIAKLRPITAWPIDRLPNAASAGYTEDLVAHELHCGLPDVNEDDTALILHSSGSTGVPKPRHVTHKVLITQMQESRGLSVFSPLPWYHGLGLVTALQAMYARKTAFLWDAGLPMTGRSFVRAMKEAKPESAQFVPYMLQLLVDEPEGIAMLKACKMVTYSGGACPDELGDRLVAEGVKFGGILGSTEAGLVAESISRPTDDRDWGYLEFFDHIWPFVRMRWAGGSSYECVYLPGHPNLNVSNAGDGSYHSGDLFVQHPTHPKRWKYVARGDDRVTLTNGEKVLPLPIEGTIRQHPLVDEAVVVGVQRAEPGLLIFRAEAAQGTPAGEILDHIWSTVEEANARAEQFSRISRAMVKVLPAGAVCPRTDKRSIIRTQVYNDFEDDINQMYSRADDRSGALQLSVDETAAHLLTLCQKELRAPISTVHDDLYSHGVDSLQAIQLRRRICRDFQFPNSTTVPQNLVYDAGNIARLAEAIYAIQHGQSTQHEDERALARDWIERYSSFSGTPGSGPPSQEKAVILTGATGSVGAHLLQTLLADESISTVYCLTRQSNPEDAVFANLRRKQITIPPAWAERIVALQSDLEQSDLGVGPKLVRQMKRSVSTIIHVAWPVNFRLPLVSFEPHIKGLRNLINFSMSVDAPVPAVLLFCSSVSTALASSSSEIEETPMGLDCALNMGYSRSKVVGEQMIDRARQAGAHAYSVRIGQVSGHSEKGLWNDSEAIPLMIRSTLTLGALPSLNISCSWLPVDHLAACLWEIANACLERREAGRCLSRHKDTVYNLVNPRWFTWSAMLKELKRHGLPSRMVPVGEWLRLLEESKARGEETVNPAVKLVDHYRATYGQGSESEKKRFFTRNVERDSKTLKGRSARIIEDGILGRYAHDWLHRWGEVVSGTLTEEKSRGQNHP